MENYCLARFYADTIEEWLNEPLYDCEDCGMGWEVGVSSYGCLSLYVGGYSHKLLPVLFKKVLEGVVGAFGRLPTSSVERERLAASLEVVKERKLKSWYNAAYKQQPIERCGDLIDEALLQNDYPILEMYEWLLAEKDSITLERLAETQKGILGKNVVAEGYLEGNVGEQDCGVVADLIEDMVFVGGSAASASSEAVLPGFRRSVRSVVDSSRLIVPTMNLKDPNSAVVCYVPIGPYLSAAEARQRRASLFGNGCATNQEDQTNAAAPDSSTLLRTRVLHLLLMQMLAQPFFANLRTKQQLGYLVSASGDFLHGQLGVRLRVQSSHTAPAEIEKRITTFVDETFPMLLKEEKKDQFDTFKRAVATKLQEQPKRLSSAFSRRWVEVAVRSFDFAWRERAIALLDEIDWAEFEAFFEREFLHKPRLWVHVNGPAEGGKEGDQTKVRDLSLGDWQMHVDNGRGV